MGLTECVVGCWMVGWLVGWLVVCVPLGFAQKSGGVQLVRQLSFITFSPPASTAIVMSKE